MEEEEDKKTLQNCCNDLQPQGETLTTYSRRINEGEEKTILHDNEKKDTKKVIFPEIYQYLCKALQKRLFVTVHCTFLSAKTAQADIKHM